MATQIQTIDKTLVKMRWKEEYVTEGLNEKTFGIIPSGIVRGGMLSAPGGQSLNVDPDPVYGDILVVYGDETSRYQTSIRVTGTQVLDLSALSGQTVYIVLFVNYTQGSETTAEWRAYTQAELDAAAEKDSLVIFGKVTVSSPITDSDIEYTERTEQWMRVGSGQIPWVPIVNNGGFEGGSSGWSQIGATCYLDTTEQYRGARCLKIPKGTGTTKIGVVQAVRFPVTPGMPIMGRMMAKAASTLETGDYGIELQFYGSTYTPISNLMLCSLELTQTTWKEYKNIVRAPASAYFVDVAVVANPSVAGTDRNVYFDDLQVFVPSADGDVFLGDKIAGDQGDAGAGRLFLYNQNYVGSFFLDRFSIQKDTGYLGKPTLFLNEDLSSPQVYISPLQDNVMGLGDPSHMWSNLYAVNVHVGATGVLSLPTGAKVVGDFIPNLANQDIGSLSDKWAEGYFSGSLHVDTNVQVSGFVDTSDLRGTKLTLSTGVGEGVDTDLMPTVHNDKSMGSATRMWRFIYATGIVLSELAGDGFGSGLKPQADDSYDIGNATYRWQHLFLSGNVRADGEVSAKGDNGGSNGYISMTGIDEGVSGSNVGTIKLPTASDNAGWLKFYSGTTAVYVPYWTTVT